MKAAGAVPADRYCMSYFLFDLLSWLPIDLLVQASLQTADMDFGVAYDAGHHRAQRCRDEVGNSEGAR